MQETPGGHTVLEAGDRVVIWEDDVTTDLRRSRNARVKYERGGDGPRAALVVIPDAPEVPLTQDATEQVVRQQLASDTTDELFVDLADSLGPHLARQLYAAGYRLIRAGVGA